MYTAKLVGDFKKLVGVLINRSHASTIAVLTSTEQQMSLSQFDWRFYVSDSSFKHHNFLHFLLFFWKRTDLCEK